MRLKIKPVPEWHWKFTLFPLRVSETARVWLEWVQWKHRTVDAGTWAGGGHGITTYRDVKGKTLGQVTEHY